jgi:hypothetical protein
MMRTDTKKFRLLSQMAKRPDGTRYSDIERMICDMSGKDYDEMVPDFNGRPIRKYKGIWGTNLTYGPKSILQSLCHKTGDGKWHVDDDVKAFLKCANALIEAAALEASTKSLSGNPKTTLGDMSGLSKEADSRVDSSLSKLKDYTAPDLGAQVIFIEGTPLIIRRPSLEKLMKNYAAENAPDVLPGVNVPGTGWADNKIEKRENTPKKDAAVHDKFETDLLINAKYLRQMREEILTLTKQRTELANRIIAVGDEVKLVEASLRKQLGLLI